MLAQHATPPPLPPPPQNTRAECAAIVARQCPCLSRRSPRDAGLVSLILLILRNFSRGNKLHDVNLNKPQTPRRPELHAEQKLEGSAVRPPRGDLVCRPAFPLAPAPAPAFVLALAPAPALAQRLTQRRARAQALRGFQRTYLVPYLLCTFADWIQGAPPEPFRAPLCATRTL